MTWGLSGGQFLLLYGSLLVAILIGTTIRRQRLMRPLPTSGKSPAAPLGVDELAYLGGGIAGLATSAVVGLRERGEVECSPRKKVIAREVELAAAATPVQRALHHALRERPAGYTARITGRLIGESRQVQAIRRRLADRNLITEGRLRTRLRWGVLAYLLLLLVGVARVAEGIENHRAVGFLILLLILTVLLGLFSLRVPPVTPAGGDALRRARGEAEHLRAGSVPGDRALAIALFGIGALWMAEPALATELGFARTNAVSAGSDASTWGPGSSCGGSSCGSSSCSSSSCGGSSCGGGGCGG